MKKIVCHRADKIRSGRAGMLRRTQTLLVCQIFVMLLFASVSNAWDLIQASSHGNHGIVVSPSVTPHGTGSNIESRGIIKCRPLGDEHSATAASGHGSECSLPEHPTGGWELTADAFFARMKGKVRFSRGIFF